MVRLGSAGRGRVRHGRRGAMRIRHYYHCYAGGAWSEPVRDHFVALARSGLDDLDITVGLVGPEHDRRMCRERIGLLCSKWGLPQPVRWLAADRAWEQLTLQQVHEDVHEIPGDYGVLYTHAKGSYTNTDGNHAWRRSMTRALIYGWEECVALLKQGYDCVGCHWMTQHGDWFFGGNFWWASAAHLRALPAPENETRWTPEVWVSLGACPLRAGTLLEPKVYDMLPGPPSYP